MTGCRRAAASAGARAFVGGAVVSRAIPRRRARSSMTREQTGCARRCCHWRTSRAVGSGRHALARMVPAGVDGVERRCCRRVAMRSLWRRRRRPTVRSSSSTDRTTRVRHLLDSKRSGPGASGGSLRDLTRGVLTRARSPIRWSSGTLLTPAPCMYSPECGAPQTGRGDPGLFAELREWRVASGRRS
jgi:hypothetical protein